MSEVEKLIIVTKKTFLEELTEKFNTKEQAKFYIEHMGGNFEEYEAAHIEYYNSLEKLERSIPSNLRFQIVERSFIPNFLFNPTDLIVVIGPDGLVINTAKYLDKQLILAINPDPSRIIGILNPFGVDDFHEQLNRIRKGNENIRRITMAKAELNDRQTIYGVNDLFIGHRSHVSARYEISYGEVSENQISSGIIITTGAGSTGWFKSILYGAMGVARSAHPSWNIGSPAESDYRFPWESNYLYFSVREPWESNISRTNIIFGRIEADEQLILSSHMPENGVIFSDGIEKDYVNFNSGIIAKIGVAEKKANLLVR